MFTFPTGLPTTLREGIARIRQSPLGARIFRGAIWSLVGALLARSLGLAVSFFLAHLLGKVGLGEFGIVNSTVGMLQTFAGFATGITATRYVAQLRVSDPERAARVIAVSSLFAISSGLLVTIFFFCFAPWLAVHALAAPNLVNELRIGTVLLLLGGVSGVQLGALSGFEAFRRVAQVSVAVGVISLVVVVSSTWVAGLRGAVVGTVTSQVLGVAIQHWALRSEARRAGIRLTYRGCLRERKVLWTFSLPATLAGVMVGPVNWACTALLVNQPNGYAQMGLYQATNQWFTAMMFLPQLLGQVALPVLSERLAQRDREGSTQALRAMIRVTLSIVIPACALLSMASPLIMRGYGDEFRDGTLTLIVSLVAAAFMGVTIPVGQVIAASNRMWTGFFLNLAWAACFIGGSAYAVRWGAVGLAAARAAAYAAHAGWTFWYALNLLNIEAGLAEPVTSDIAASGANSPSA